MSPQLLYPEMPNVAAQFLYSTDWITKVSSTIRFLDQTPNGGLLHSPEPRSPPDKRAPMKGNFLSPLNQCVKAKTYQIKLQLRLARKVWLHFRLAHTGTIFGRNGNLSDPEIGQRLFNQ